MSIDSKIQTVRDKLATYDKSQLIEALISIQVYLFIDCQIVVNELDTPGEPQPDIEVELFNLISEIVS